MKKVIFGYLAFITACSLLFIGLRSYVFSDDILQPVYKSENGISYCARVKGTAFQIYDGSGGWSQSFLTGVDIGSGKPGSFPGELAVTEDEYYRWFEEIGAMHANVIRIYIPQTPAFYKALYRYNEAAAYPLYLIQGVYVNEEEVSKYHNVYAAGSSLNAEFRKDIVDAVNIIHGNATIAPEPGKASGSYTYDVSKYVVGWILGIEWNKDLVIGTNASNPEKTSFDGRYCYTADASPFEVFLAETAELAVGYETAHYGMQRPVAFCNWPTTDPLTHPNDPFRESEDAVTVDVEHIHATGAFEPGFFASYHVYPYYPDFMSYEPKYLIAGSNPYKEYLKELTAYHTMPVLVSEFGLPTSRGKAHTNQVTGLNQGYLDEESQGKGLVSMLSDIHDTGCMGGIVFSWQDEWFKTTWNTMDIEDASGRPEWFNVMSAEQNFGILSFDTSAEVIVDGKRGEWTMADIVADNGSQQVSVKEDEAYLYLLAKVDDFYNDTYFIPIDTLSGAGNDSYDGTSFSRSPDFLLILSGKDNTRLLVDPYYNPNCKLYGNLLFTDAELALYDTKNSGTFIDVSQVVNRPLYLPETKQTVEKELFPAGHLRYGNADPAGAHFNSLSDFCEDGGYVEIRIPWQMLNVADPSEREILSDLHAEPGFTFQAADTFYFGIGKAGTPGISMSGYKLSGWAAPTASERLKQSYGILKEDFKKIATFTVHTPLKPETISAVRRFYIHSDAITNGLVFVSYLLFFALTLLVYMYAVLIIVNIRLCKRDELKLWEKEKLLSLCNMPASDVSSHLHMKFLCSAEGVDTVYEILNDGAAWQRDRLTTILRKAGYSRYLRRLLYAINTQDICLVIKVAAMLGFREFEGDIVKHMTKKRNDLHLQYIGFLALSLLGCRDTLIKLCKDSSDTMILSYRCLKEILSAYSGDKRELYGELLYSPDGFIRRICIKVIGDEGYTEFEDALIPMLEAKDVNLLCDVIRTLGQLGSRKAGGRILALAGHEDWTVRNVALVALGSIDIYTYVKALEKGLGDKEWWVRYNSAKALCAYEYIEEVQASVARTDDRFAKEILTYVIAENEIYKKAGAVGIVRV